MNHLRSVMRAATAAVAAMAVTAAAGGCKKDAGAGAGGPPGGGRPPAAVTAAQAIARDVPVYLDEIGKTAAREYVNVMPQVTGQVQSLHFADGQDVKKGELLFTLDPRPFEAAVAQADANVAQQQASLDLAKQEFKRVQGLVETKAISQQDFDQRQSAVTVGEAQVKAAEAAVRTAKLNLEYCTIKSTVDGRVSQRQVDPGNIVKANEASLVIVQRLDPIYADFTIPEQELPRVRKHMADGTLRTEVTVPGQVATAVAKAVGGGAGGSGGEAPAAPPAGPATNAAPTNGSSETGPSRTGELTFLDTMVQQGLGTVKLRATLKNDDRYFWPGQFVNVRLILETRKGATLVPQQAIQIGQKGTYVYVVKADGTADMRPVREGQRQGDLVVVDAVPGMPQVAVGEQVIVTGQTFIGPGAKVHVIDPAGAGQGPGGGGQPAAGGKPAAKADGKSSDGKSTEGAAAQ